jgi:hypothetical protein
LLTVFFLLEKLATFEVEVLAARNMIVWGVHDRADDGSVLALKVTLLMAMIPKSVRIIFQ